MAKKRKAQFKTQTTSIESAVSDAYSGMEELKDELQNWYDNLPESFQNGSKGDALQSAIDQIDCASEITVPDCLCNGPDLPEVSYDESVKTSRSARRDTCVSMLNGAADAARDYIDTLNELEFDEDGNRKRTLTEGDDDVEEDGYPTTEDERDSWVSEIEDFANECENNVGEYEAVEFPGMYG
jgi:hypothetical protein